MGHPQQTPFGTGANPRRDALCAILDGANAVRRLVRNLEGADRARCIRTLNGLGDRAHRTKLGRASCHYRTQPNS
jgi:hypothetical protein